MRVSDALVAVVLLVGLCFTGCASKDSGIRGVSRGDADRMNADRSGFDSSKEPAINANTYFASGQLAESQQARVAAIEQYKKAVKADPKHQPSLYRLGILYAELKQFPDAIDAWKQYVKATGESAAAYSNLAYCYELAGRPTDAESTYKKGIEREPKSVPCRVNYGLMLARHDRMSEATIQLQAVLTPAQVHYNLASVHEQRGRTEQARAEYQKALEADPGFTDAQSRLAALE